MTKAMNTTTDYAPYLRTVGVATPAGKHHRAIHMAGNRWRAQCGAGTLTGQITEIDMHAVSMAKLCGRCFPHRYVV